MTKRDFLIIIGNVLDHFDTALYGFLAPILAPLFFPAYEPVVQIILAYSLLAASFVTRPVGTYIFGVMARNHGPVLGLSYSLMGVALTTVCIGCLPTYATIGWLAPLGLLLLRMLAGIFGAGEVIISQLYILEGKPHKDARQASYLYQSSTVLGIILASGAASVTIILNNQTEIAWRLCFWIGAAAGFVGYYLRTTTLTQETLDLDRAAEFFAVYRVPALTNLCSSLWHHRRNVLCIACASIFYDLTYYLPFVFMNSFVPMISAISLETMMTLNTVLLVFDMVIIPVLGRLVLKYDATKVMLTATLVLAVTIIPLFQGLHEASLAYVTFMRFWVVVWGVVFLCPLNVWSKMLFNSGDQYLLVGMGGAIGALTLGRATPAICLWLWYAKGTTLAPACYIAFIMVATAIAVKAAKIRNNFL